MLCYLSAPQSCVGRYSVEPDLLQCLLAARAAESSGNWLLAASRYRSALVHRPSDHRLHANHGNALWLAGQPEAAAAAYTAAIELAPEAALPHLGLGNALRELNAFLRADAAYRRSRELRPDPHASWNHSQLLLGLERYREAFSLAEQRLGLGVLPAYRADACTHDHPTLRLQPSGTPLHLWSEQGFGDTFQYLRWLVPLTRQPHAITLEVEAQLVELLRQGLAWLDHPPQVIAKSAAARSGEAIAAAHASLLSLPFHLGDAPLGAVVPYLRSSSWPRCPDARACPRIGIVWAAGRKLDDPFTAREYRKRSLSMPALTQLIVGLRQAGVQIVNLQVGPDRAIPVALSAQFDQQLPAQADFAATAAVVRQLDLVISVDTAMAHLAGALGHPAWVLLPWSADPRWLLDRSDSPWYPTVRLWRQPAPADWSSVVEAVLQALPTWWRQVSSGRR